MWDNREGFVDFVQENDLVVMNTMFNTRNKTGVHIKTKTVGIREENHGIPQIMDS